MGIGVTILKFFTKKITKSAAWLLPGLQVKRWLLLLFIGSLFLLLGTAILFDARPISFLMDLIKLIALKVPSYTSGSVLLGIGVLLFLKGWLNSNSSILEGVNPREQDNVLENLYRKRMLNKGPKIVAIGGGTGLSTILKGLKHITNNLTAIVTVGDDGGSSGRLRKEMGVLPPGDIRNCIAALASEEDLVTKLFQYRFEEGNGLEGHSFGNLFLSALCNITGDMMSAVIESSKVLAIRGKVLPATLDDMRLVAQMEDGRVIYGESNIPKAKGKIQRLYSEPTKPKALDAAIKAIKDADLIIMGPGSLYTSIIPNLLIKDISQAISKSHAHKAYICNIMTQPGETDGFSVADHVKTILAHAGYNNIIDAVIINDSLPNNLAKKYKQVGAHPVVIDVENIKKMGVKIINSRLIEENDQGLVRHCPKRLSRVVYRWYRHMTVRPNKEYNHRPIPEDLQEVK